MVYKKGESGFKGRKHGIRFKQEISERTKDANNYFWKGGRSETWNGYRSFRVLNHPFGNKKRKNSNWSYVREHRLIVEECLSKQLGVKVYLGKSIVIHHKNNIKTDNRIENLEMMTKKQHDKMKKVKPL